MNSSDQKVQDYLVRAGTIAAASIPNWDKIKDDWERAQIIVSIAQLVRVESVRA